MSVIKFSYDEENPVKRYITAGKVVVGDEKETVL